MQTDNSKYQDNLQDKTRPNSKIREDLSDYVDKRLELFKLSVYEKSAQSGAFIVYGLILLLLFCVTFLLSLMGLAFFIGSYFDSLALGFGILVVVNLVLMAIFIAVRKQFRRKTVNFVIRILQKIELNEE